MNDLILKFMCFVPHGRILLAKHDLYWGYLSISWSYQPGGTCTPPAYTVCQGTEGWGSSNINIFLEETQDQRSDSDEKINSVFFLQNVSGTFIMV